MKDPKPKCLTDPVAAALRAARIIGAVGEYIGEIDGLPEGEVIWRENNDTVTLTPDGWLVCVISGTAPIYGRRVRATPALVAQLRGKPK